jgi:hypothetical protein
MSAVAALRGGPGWQGIWRPRSKVSAMPKSLGDSMMAAKGDPACCRTASLSAGCQWGYWGGGWSGGKLPTSLGSPSPNATIEVQST